MKRKARIPKRGTTVTPETKHICDDCKHSKWVEAYSNLDWQGKPICLTCPFEKWHIIRGHKACDKWEPKQKEVQP